MSKLCQYISFSFSWILKVSKSIFINPLLPETFFPSNLEIEPKISSHRLPTHRQGILRVSVTVEHELERLFKANIVLMIAYLQKG